MNYILSMDLDEFWEFVDYLFEKEKKDALTKEWYAVYPYMMLEQLKYMDLEEYIARRTGENIDARPADEIIGEIEKLHGRRLMYGIV